MLIFSSTTIVDSTRAFKKIKLDQNYKLGQIFQAAINVPMSFGVIYWIFHITVMLDVYLKALKIRQNVSLFCSRLVLLTVVVPVVICFFMVMVINIYSLPKVFELQNCTEEYAIMLRINWYLFQVVVIMMSLLVAVIVVFLARLQNEEAQETPHDNDNQYTTPGDTEYKMDLTDDGENSLNLNQSLQGTIVQMTKSNPNGPYLDLDDINTSNSTNPSNGTPRLGHSNHSNRRL